MQWWSLRVKEDPGRSLRASFQARADADPANSREDEIDAAEKPENVEARHRPVRQAHVAEKERDRARQDHPDQGVHLQCLPRPARSPGCGHASRYQSLRLQKVLSQPLSVALSFLEIATTRGRHTTGMTTPSSTARSFIAMKSAARLTGSSSPSAA